MINQFRYCGIRLVQDPYLEWQIWKIEPDLVIMGGEIYPHIVYTLQVKPHVLETDPGPLDARVP